MAEEWPLDIANNYSSLGLPKIDAIACFMGSGAYKSMATFPLDTKLLLVRAEHDAYVDVTLAAIEATWDSLAHIPCYNKRYLQVNSDSVDTTVLNADYFFFFSNINVPQTINPLNFYGSWRLITAIFDCTFSATNCDHWLLDSDSITYMGKWSNNTPVTPITILDTCSTTVVNEFLNTKSQPIIIYPNPFDNFITIESNRIQTFYLINLLGQTVFQVKLNNTSKEIILPENLKYGIYFYTTQSKSGLPQTGKLVKKLYQDVRNTHLFSSIGN